MLFFSISLICTFNWCIHGTHGRESPTIRLVGGYHNESEGRIEVFHEGQWGTVCDSFWDPEDADVACRQLGYEEAVSNPSDAYFGEGSGKIWIDKIDCTGDEKTIFDCDIEYDNPLCCNDHANDASVVCRTTTHVQNVLRQNMSATASDIPPLKILHDSEWGQMCKEGWDYNAANVACHMLGFDRIYVLTFSPLPKNQRRWLGRVKCKGTERNIDECGHSIWGDYNCDKVVSVACTGSYDGVACGGRVCENSQHCCRGIGYDYCCNRSSPTTITTTASTAAIPEKNSSLILFVVFPFIIAIIVIVAIWKTMCYRQSSNERNSNTEERVVPNQIPERQPAQHNLNFVDPSLNPTFKAKAPPAYDTIDFQKTNNEDQSELPPPAYSAS